MNWMQHAPALQVVAPLLAAPLIVLVRRLSWAYAIAVAACALAFFFSIGLWSQVQSTGVIAYAIGNWPPPWGIEYRVDALNAFILCLVSGTGLAVLLFSRSSNAHEVPSEQRYLFYAMFCLCLAGLLGMAITGDAFNIFVFFEISALSTYVLIAIGRQRQSGTLNLVDMGQRLSQVDSMRPVYAAFAFISAGVFLKLALFPFHNWLPNAYTYAPTTVSAFLAATATKVSIYVLLRFYFTVFHLDAITPHLPLSLMLGALAIAGMFAGSATAIFQTDMKRLLAFSSVGQIGYIMLGIALFNASGLTAGLVHLFNHGITKGASFLLLGLVVTRLGGTQMSHLSGLGKTMPWTAFGLLICGLSLIGVPGTAGFISKLYLVRAALDLGLWWVALMVLLSSLLAVAYVWKFVEAAYFRPPPEQLSPSLANVTTWDMRLMALLLTLSTVYFGFDTRFTLGSAQAAAQYLLGAH